MNTCANCGTPLRTRVKKARYCADRACQRVSNRERMREFQRRWTVEHGEPYTARYRDKRRAYDRAQIAAGRGPRARNPDAAQASDQRRRARKAGAEAETFTAAEIHDRDRWVCGLCNQPIDPALRSPDPGSASIDHVIPLSAGGHHTRSNIQSAHLGCNVRKGARVA